jgi:hypothetical protein
LSGLSRDSSSTTSPRAGSSSTTSPTPRIRVPRHVARLIRRLVVDYFASSKLIIDYFAYAARSGASAHRAARHAVRHRLLRLRRTSRCLGTSRGSSRDSSRGSSSSTSPTPRVRVPRHVARLVTRLVVDYFTYAACTGASAHRAARHAARCRLLRLRCASGCLGTSHGSSRGSSRRSSLTTSPTPARPGASAHCANRHVARRAARRRLLRLRRASGCLGTSCSSSRRLSSTTSPTPRVWVPRHVTRLVVDYFNYATCPGASVRCVARRATCRRLLRLRRASVCLGTSRGSSRGSLSTTSTTPHIRVPRHVARLVTRLVVDYSVRRDFLLWPHWLYFSHAMLATTCLAATLALLRVRRAPPRRRLPVASHPPFISTSFPNLSRTAVTPPTTGRNQL